MILAAPVHVIGHRAPTDLMTLSRGLVASVLLPLAEVSTLTRHTQT